MVGCITVVKSFTDKSDSYLSLFIGCELFPGCIFIQVFYLFLLGKSLLGAHENGDVLKLLKTIHWISSFLYQYKSDCLGGWSSIWIVINIEDIRNNIELNLIKKFSWNDLKNQTNDFSYHGGNDSFPLDLIFIILEYL